MNHLLNSPDLSMNRQDASHLEKNAFSHLLPELITEMSKVQKRIPYREARVFELGCGNGSAAYAMERQGWTVTSCPERELATVSASGELAARFGTFPVVTSLELVGHARSPQQHAATVFSLLQPGGTAILSAPYHGYWKNMALALSGQWHAHLAALRERGHTRFWSVDTLSQLLREAGFRDIRVIRLGRLPALAKSMIVVARKP